MEILRGSLSACLWSFRARWFWLDGDFARKIANSTVLDDCVWRLSTGRRHGFAVEKLVQV